MDCSNLPVFVPMPEGTPIKPPQTLQDVIDRMLGDTAAVRQRVMAAVPGRAAQDRKTTDVLEGILSALGSLQAYGISPDDMPDGLWEIRHELVLLLAAHRKAAALFLADRDNPCPDISIS